MLRLLSLCFAFALTLAAQSAEDWMRYVRIAGHSLGPNNAEDIVRSAEKTHVFGIEVDNDITGRYESFLDPTAKLEAIRKVAAKAHETGNYAFVYIAGTECITANAAASPHSMAKDHPDWLQRKITGEPANFGGGVAFWVRKGDEDVWITPLAPEWRKIYMERVRQIAGTGIDGIYVDIPYWMTHFDGWEDTWASFDDWTVAAFRQKTGLNAKTDLKLGDFRDANFRRWVDFRIDVLTDFMRDIAENARSVNPKCRTIAEIYPGIEESAVRVGSDVYDLYRVVDTVAHEYSTGGSSARRTPLTWFNDLTGMYSFRAFAGDKPSWMLSYSWEKDKVSVADAMENLAMAQLMAGTNTWDAQGHVMSGSNDYAARTRIFGWIKEHEKRFFRPRQPIRPIGVYFSPKTRNYFAKEFIESYRGMMQMLMQAHLEFQIVTPRTLDAFEGKVLIVPDARCIGQAEVAGFRQFIGRGGALAATGETGRYDETGAELARNPVRELPGVDVLYRAQCPGRAYYAALEKEFKPAPPEYLGELKKASGWKPAVEVAASPFVATQIAAVDGKPCVFLANFKGLVAKQVARQTPETNVRVTFDDQKLESVYVLPFLGQPQKLPATRTSGKLSATIPSIERGALIWAE